MPDFIEIQPQNRQTLADIAIMHYGSFAGVEHLLLDNRDRLDQGFATYLPGITLRVRVDEPTDKKTLAEVKRLKIKPATGLRQNPPTIGPDYNDDYNEDHYIE